MSLSSSCSAAVCSSVLTLILCLRGVTVAATVRAPDLQEVGAPLAASAPRRATRSSPRTGRRPAGRQSAAAMTSPRPTSISASRVSVTDCPATARCRSPSGGDDARDRASRPDGRIRTAVARPDAAADDAAGRSRGSPRFGRFTHCTGRRNGPVGELSRPLGTLSRCSISVGPSIPRHVARRAA